MQIINKISLGLIALLLLAVMLMFFHPLSYLYYQIARDECVDLENLCIDMDPDWYLDYQSMLAHFIVGGDRDVVTMSTINGLKRERMANFVVVNPVNISDKAVFISEYNELYETAGEVMLVNNRSIGKDDGKTRMFLPMYNLLVVSNSDAVLFEIVSIKRR